MNLKFIKFILICLALFIQNKFIYSQVKNEPRSFNFITVIIKGVGNTHKEALRDAFKKAIENAAGVFVQSESEVKNYQLKKDRILTYAEGYIHRYKLLDKYIDLNNDVILKVEAVVSNERIYNDLVSLQILQMIVGNPSILVFYESYSHQNPRYIHHAINAVNEYLLQYNYNIVDLKQAEQIAISDEQLYSSQNLNYDLANHFKANIYINGNYSVQQF